MENIAEFTSFLENINSFEFDVFRFDELCKNNCLIYFSYDLFGKYNYFKYIDEVVFKNFIKKIRDGYSRDNSYHNDIHATDVLQTCVAIVENGDLSKVKSN